MKATEKLSHNNPGRLTPSEVAEKLAPAISLHGIEVQNDYLKFPGISPMVGVPESELPEADTPVIIRFENIGSITPFSGHIELLLHSGELYTFSLTDAVRTHIYTYKSGGANVSPKRETTAKDIADNIWEGLEEKLNAQKK